MLRHNSLEQECSGELTLAIGGLVFRLMDRSVVWRGKHVKLSGVELKLLVVLMRYAGETLSRLELNQRVRGKPFHPDDRSIDVATLS